MDVFLDFRNRSSVSLCSRMACGCERTAVFNDGLEQVAEPSWRPPLLPPRRSPKSPDAQVERGNIEKKENVVYPWFGWTMGCTSFYRRLYVFVLCIGQCIMLDN